MNISSILVVILLLVCGLLAFFVYTNDFKPGYCASQGNVTFDKHNCLLSAGYTWSNDLNACVKWDMEDIQKTAAGLARNYTCPNCVSQDVISIDDVVLGPNQTSVVYWSMNDYGANYTKENYDKRYIYSIIINNGTVEENNFVPGVCN